MNSIILINKPKNYTSRDVVNVISKKLNIKKIGHTGTLDPIAEGVLILCTNKYTRFVEYITNYDKEYVVEGEFGYETDTLDVTGSVVKECKLDINIENFNNVLKNFVGEIEQIPPIYSAIKVKGKKLYEYARNNENVDIPKRTVNIYSIELLEFSNNTFKLKCNVSKGTYIRSLIRDIGLSLNTFATMKSLIRTKQGKVNIEDCGTISDLKYGNILNLIDIPIIRLEDYSIIKHGQKLKEDYKFPKVLFVDISDVPLAIYKKVEDIYKCEKMFL